MYVCVRARLFVCECVVVVVVAEMDMILEMSRLEHNQNFREHMHNYLDSNACDCILLKVAGCTNPWYTFGGRSRNQSLIHPGANTYTYTPDHIHACSGLQLLDFDDDFKEKFADIDDEDQTPADLLNGLCSHTYLSDLGYKKFVR